MAPLSVRQFTAYVGIDWGDTKHDICLQASGDDKREFDCIPHQVARIDEWAKVSPHLMRSIWLAAQNSLVNRGRQC